MSRIAVLALACSLAACSTKRTEVVIGVATDLAAPGALDQVKLEIYRNGVLAFDIPPWDIPGQAGDQFVLPASFGVYSDDSSEPRVEVLVHGMKSGSIIVTRRSILALIKEKTLFLRMALVQRCVSRAECPNQTDSCVEGKCKTAVVDARILKDYTANLENIVQCSSGTTFINTHTMAAIPAMGSCAADEFCEEGACYKLPPGVGDGGADGGVTIPTTPGWSQLPIPPADSPAARRFENGSQAAANATTLMVWGGRDLNNQPVNDTWGFDGSVWTKLANDIGPIDTVTMQPPDPTGPTVFDPSTNLFVTYREPSGDLIAFDGAHWVVKNRGSDSGVPPPRTQSALGVDEGNGKVILAGGFCTGTSALCTDMWAWDSSGWTSLGSLVPQPRKNGSMAFDATLSKVVLFGGRAASQFADTWGWNGSMWLQLATTFPNTVVFSTGGLLTFDSDKNRLLWLNGTREIYNFDGSTWSQTLIDPNGPLLGTFSGAYFKKVHAIVAFGGSDSRNAPLSTTWVLNVP